MRIILVTCLLIATFVGNGIAQHALEVVVKNVKTAEGTVRVAIFTNEDDFLKNAYQGKSVKASTGTVSVSFEGLPKGPYAISIFHDENDNGELDTNFMGIPKEGFAFGNNAMGTFGPPSFDRAKVEVTEKSTKQEIDLRFM
jgi:uncharacterized protein (DUF2141 family)